MPVDKNKIEQISERSEYFQDILEKIPPKIISWGNTGMLIIFVVIIIGLKLIRYPEVIDAEAVITNDKPSVEVYSKSNGRISQFFKQDQDIISKDEWILIINNSANYNDVLQVIKLVKRPDSVDFWKYIDDLKLNESLILGDIQTPYFSFSRSIGELRLYAKMKSLNIINTISKKQEVQLNSKRKSLVNQLSNSTDELEIRKADFERTNKLYNLKVVNKLELEEKQILFLNAKKNVDEINASLINIQIEHEILSKEENSRDIERDDKYLKLRNDVVQNFSSLVFSLSEWKTKYVLISPISGKLDLYDIRNKNQYVTEEKRVFTITPPDAKRYFSIIKLPVSNSGKVHKGQTCIIKLQNYPYAEFGMIKGIIQSISLNSKDGFYSASVELPNQLTTTQHKKLSPTGELIGTAEIVIEDLSLFDRIFYSLIRRSY